MYWRDRRVNFGYAKVQLKATIAEGLERLPGGRLLKPYLGSRRGRRTGILSDWAIVTAEAFRYCYAPLPEAALLAIST